MQEPYANRNWGERHGTLSAGIGELARQSAVAFERLVARAYDAPWERVAQRRAPARVKRGGWAANAGGSALVALMAFGLPWLLVTSAELAG